MTLDVHIVTHTHWDREWYLPRERFRQRLVALVDELLDDPSSPPESFLLDGQVIVVEDYLAVRPERTAELRRLLESGRLEAGPWYVLGDELIPGGEAIVRNLLVGRRILRRLGATAPPVLYCPDSFGHPAVLPSIAAGFGFSLIILWRGYGGPHWPAGDAVRWHAPNGDDALVFHLPRDGYELGSNLPADPTSAQERWQRMRAELVPRSATGVTLVPNGADHHARQQHFHEALTLLECAGEADGVHRSSLSRFAAALIQRSAATRLPVIRGELRDSYGYTWTLQGTFGTRAHEKRMNARAERRLLREAEPWCALAARGGRSRRPLIDAAWHTLLAAHPHDTLCGCSIDQVAEAMEARLRSASNQAIGLCADAIADLLGHDPVAARTARDRWRPVVVLRNAAPRSRSGVAILEVEEFIADVPVGPGSPSTAPSVDSGRGARRRKPNLPSFGAVQVLSRAIANRRTESPRHYPDNDLVAVTRVATWISDAPPYGIVAYPIGAGDTTGGPLPPPAVVTTPTTLRNGRISLTVAADGSVSVDEVETGWHVESLISLMEEADVGDLYTPAPRARAHTVQFRGVRRVHRGPLRGELTLSYRVVDASSKRRRVDADVLISLVVDANAPFIRIGVSGQNHQVNHRLRLRVDTGVVDGAVWADAAFGPVCRDPIAVGRVESLVEMPPPTAPLHRYVSVFGADIGATLISDGLAEYEAADDGSVVVTLVRSVGELSRNDLPERPGHAGWPMATPGAQCLGPFEAKLAVMFHGPRTVGVIDAIEHAADDVLLPLAGATLRSALAVPAPVIGVELIGQGLALSALKESEDGEWMMVRCLNLTDDHVAGRWRFPFVCTEARLARLDETVVSKLECLGRDVPFLAPPRAIVTILVR